MASLGLVLTFEDKAPLIVVLRGIDPVILGRLLLFAWFGFDVVVVAVVAFLDAVLMPCANTPELVDAVKSITAPITIAPYISRFFLLVSFVLFVVVVIIAIS
jgi:hypothetical protein